MKNYSSTIAELEKKIQELADSGIEIQPLNSSVDELKRHLDNVEKIEENIEAIREEVIEKIKEELEFNKKAGSFSIYGFWVGSIALIMSIISIGSDFWFSNDGFSLIDSTKSLIQDEPTNRESTRAVIDRVESIDYKVGELLYHLVGFDRANHVDSSEFLIASTYDGRIRAELFNDSLMGKIEMGVVEVSEEPDTDSINIKPSAILVFFVDDRKIGLQGIREIFRWRNENYLLYDSYDGGVRVFEGDTVTLFNDQFVIETIYTTKTEIRRVGDDKDAVRLKKVSDFDYREFLERNQDTSE